MFLLNRRLVNFREFEASITRSVETTSSTASAFQSIALNLVIGLVISLSLTQTFANEQDTQPSEKIEQILVIGEPDTLAGAGNVIEAEELERFDYSDINQVLSSVPGIYIREEEGYGLRPNIGIRGAAAERSLKITIMEDGVLIAPAPYSAPAAYYVPNISRISGVEVLKGPSAIQTGPHTVGGAINLLTREIPDSQLRELDLGIGTDAFYKTAFGIGGPVEDKAFSYLLSGLSYGTKGFKELDGGGDTGFERNDIDVKFRWRPANELKQQLTLKLAYANEDADETYLGLTDHDFRVNPVQRYSASQLARFRSDHTNVHLNYGMQIGEIVFNGKAYWNSFERSWNKLDGFIFGRSLQSILSAPHLFDREYKLLLGSVDSQRTDSQTLEITNNDRSFSSQGLQLAAISTASFTNIDHELTVGLRLHGDRVQRHHMPRGYLMTNGELVYDGISREPKSFNKASSTALALFASDDLTWRDLTLTLGLRYENIEGEFDNLNIGSSTSNSQSVLTPGFGLYWQVTNAVGLLAGVHQGFSPVGPGAMGVKPEQSLNYEAGVRMYLGRTRVESVAFLSDYENLLGRCRVSDAGCEAGQEFNGGEVKIKGLELNAEWIVDLTPGFQLNTSVVYTYTDSVFENSFLSGFSQWGLVREGDELPYLPRHRGKLQTRLSHGDWEVALAFKQQTAMRETPGTEDIESALHADAYQTIDLTTSWKLREATMLQIVVGNVLNESAIVSHRPFGARPNRPRWFTLRVRSTF